MKQRFSLSILAFFLVSVFAVPAFSAANTDNAPCPPLKDVKQIVKKTFRKSISVEKIQPAQVEGLCQVQIKFQNRKRVLYIDSHGKYIIPGDVYRTSDGRNLTRTAMMEINRFTEPQMKTLEKFVAFTIGDKGPVIYFVTDPQCPYCKKAEAILEPMAKAGQLQVKVLLFPLKFHKGAKEECISIVCDKKGLEGLKTRYRSENQCAEGKKLIQDTVRFLQSKGITGTPTYIFPDGRFQSGVLAKDKLLNKLGQHSGKKADKPEKKENKAKAAH